jgi:hypothetical protein
MASTTTRTKMVLRNPHHHYHHHYNNIITSIAFGIIVLYSTITALVYNHQILQHQDLQQLSKYKTTTTTTTTTRLVVDDQSTRNTNRDQYQLVEEQKQEEYQEEEDQSSTVVEDEVSTRDEPSVWIIQGDSTPLLLQSNNTRLSSSSGAINSTDWMNLMATINFKYAKRHGYGYKRFIFEDKDQCIHPVYGKRHIAWCKLLPVARLARQYSQTLKYVIWIDSDAMLQHQHLNISEIIDTVPAGCHENSVCTEKLSPDCQQYKRDAALLTAANQPFCGEPPLTAFQIWNFQSSNAWSILQDWWNSPRCADEHPWEQRAFARDVYPKHALDDGGGITVLYEEINHPKLPEEQLRQKFMRHVGHTASLNGAGSRLAHSQNVARNVEMTDDEYMMLQSQLHHHDSDYLEKLTTKEMNELSQLLWKYPDEHKYNSPPYTNNLTNVLTNCDYVVNQMRYPKYSTKGM